VQACIASYNDRRANASSSRRSWGFGGLHAYMLSLDEEAGDKLLTKTLPKMGRLALRLDDLFTTVCS